MQEVQREHHRVTLAGFYPVVCYKDAYKAQLKAFSRNLELLIQTGKHKRFKTTQFP